MRGDHEALGRLIAGYQLMVTTPHVLAEVSNFIDQAPMLQRPALSAALAEFATLHREEYEAASKLVTMRAFESLGVADTGLLSLSRHAMILTTDGRLYSQILAAGGHAINFNHLRGDEILKGR